MWRNQCPILLLEINRPKSQSWDFLLGGLKSVWWQESSLLWVEAAVDFAASWLQLSCTDCTMEHLMGSEQDGLQAHIKSSCCRRVLGAAVQSIPEPGTKTSPTCTLFLSVLSSYRLGNSYSSIACCLTARSPFLLPLCCIRKCSNSPE